MNKEQKNKYAFELMVKNNPDEAVKQLIMLNKLKDKYTEYNKWLEKQYLDSGKCLAFARIKDNREDIRKYTRDSNLYQQCIKKLDILEGDSDGTNSNE